MSFFFFHLAYACSCLLTAVALLAELGYTSVQQLKISDYIFILVRYNGTQSAFAAFCCATRTVAASAVFLALAVQ
jgi:hypothetical protein